MRCTNCGYAANVEAVRVPGARRRRRMPACRPRTSRTPPTPRRSTPSSTTSTSAFPRATDRPWTAGDTLKNVLVMLVAPRRHARAARHRPARRPRGRREAARRPGGAGRPSRPSTRRTSPRTRRCPRATSGPGSLGSERASGIRYLLDPRVSRGHRAGSPAPTSPAATSSTSSPAATSPPTARSRRPRCATATPARRAAHGAGVGARHRDGPHLPARHEVRRGARPQGARRERQAASP